MKREIDSDSDSDQSVQAEKKRKVEEGNKEKIKMFVKWP